MSVFGFKISTPLCEFYSGGAEYVSLDTADGRVGFLRGALPRVIAVKRGTINVKLGAVDQTFYCADGIARVDKHEITIITPYCSADEPYMHKESAISKKAGDSEFRYAKARIISAIADMNSKSNTDE